METCRYFDAFVRCGVVSAEDEMKPGSPWVLGFDTWALYALGHGWHGTPAPGYFETHGVFRLAGLCGCDDWQ